MSEELRPLAPGLAADLERIGRELDEGRRALREVVGPGAAPAYRLADVLALLDRIEAELEAALDAPVLGPLRDLFKVAITEAREELEDAAGTAAAVPVRRRPGIALAAWRLGQRPGVGERSVPEDQADSVLDDLRTLIEDVKKRALGDDLVVPLCVCASLPRIYFWIVHYTGEKYVTGGWTSKPIDLIFGIYSIQIGLNRRDRRTVLEPLDLRARGSNYYCEVDSALCALGDDEPCSCPKRRP